MSRVCDVCGKGTLFGNNVSHAKNRTRRTWVPNLQQVRTKIDGTVFKNVCRALLWSQNGTLDNPNDDLFLPVCWTVGDTNTLTDCSADRFTCGEGEACGEHADGERRLAQQEGVGRDPAPADHQAR